LKKFILLIIIIILLFTATSCGGLRNINSIYAWDYIIDDAGETLTLNISVKKAYRSGDYTNFAHSRAIHDFAELVENNNKDYRLTTQIYQDEYILITRQSEHNENISFFLIKSIDKIDNEQENRYLFFAPIAHLRSLDGAVQNSIDIHIPYHLMVNIDPQMYRADFYIENEKTVTFTYETIGTIDDYFDFYAAYGIYGVESIGDNMNVTGARGINFNAEIKITVFIQDDKTYATFDFVTFEN